MNPIGPHEPSDQAERLETMIAEAGLGEADEPVERAGHRSGFVSLVGRPNVGKSTLLNTMLGEKVSITSSHPQTTRHQIRGILHRADAQIVFVDTPGIHKPRTPMGERLNDTASDSLEGVDVVALVVDAASGIGPGDRRLADRVGPSAVLVLNKCDLVRPEKVAQQLEKASEFDFAAYFPVSAHTGEGLDVLLDHLVARLPEGPRWYPRGTTSDQSEQFRVSELVREELLAVTREELPHSIATRVTEWEWPRIRVEISVERESQKPMVIGKGGSVLKEVGTRVRRQLPDGAFLELHVSVDRNWQRDPRSLDRLGY